MSATPAESPEGATSSTSWSMGVYGQVAKTAANLTAMGLICVMFWNAMSSQQAALREAVASQQTAARDDRSAYREDLRTMHNDSDHQWQAITKLQTSQEDVARAIKEQQSATQEILRALSALTAEIKELKAAKPSPLKPQD